MSDVNFINSYNEIVFENFIAVLKQNMVFQTQLKLLEAKVAKLDEVEKQLAAIKEQQHEINQLHVTVQSLNDELSGKNAQIQNQSSVSADHYRIQAALNEKTRECDSLQGSMRETTLALEQTIQQQIDYIKKLEDLLPNNKRKKLGLLVSSDPTINTLDNVKLTKIESSGGMF